MKARSVYRLSTYIMLAAFFANVAGVFYLVRALRRPISYSVNVIEPPAPPSFDPLPMSSTNQFVLSQDAPAPVSSVVLPRSWRMPYLYFVSEGRRVAYLNGEYYYNGSRHAYGIIADIFPERINFVNGDFIENTKERTHNDTGSIGFDTTPTRD